MKYHALFLAIGLSIALVVASPMSSWAAVIMNGAMATPGDPSDWNEEADVWIFHTEGPNGVVLNNMPGITTIVTENLLLGSPVIGGVGKLTVTGLGASWEVRDLLEVGNLANSHGVLDVRDGGMIKADRLHLAMSVGSVGVMNVSGGIVLANSIEADNGMANLTLNGGIFQPLSSTGGFLTGNFNNLYLDGSGLSAGVAALTLQVDAGLTVGVSQVFTGDGGLAKTGYGTLVLNGAQSYTGLTDVASGLLTGEVSFAGGLTVRDGAIFAPGNGIWTTTIGGDYTQEPGAVLAMEIGRFGSDRLVVGGDVSLGGILALSFTDDIEEGRYVLIECLGEGVIQYMFDTMMVDGVLIERDFLYDSFDTAWFPSNDWWYMLSSGDGRVELTVSSSPPAGIPEPTALALLALGATVLCGRRRRGTV